MTRKYKIYNRYENGNIEREHYLLNSQLHREDGPATIKYEALND